MAEELALDPLIAFLIEMAEDERRLKKFLKAPEKVAEEAGLSRADIRRLMTRNAHIIFDTLHRPGAEPLKGEIVWIYQPAPPPPPTRSARPATRRARRVTKTGARGKTR
jgi:hypothetical protein